MIDRAVGMWASTEGPRSELVARFGQKEKEGGEGNEEDYSFTVDDTDPGG